MMPITSGPKIAKKPPSKLKEDQLSGKNLVDKFKKPKILQFLNINDFSSYPDSIVSNDEALFQPTPVVIQFRGYEPLQTKMQILKLRYYFSSLINSSSIGIRIKCHAE